MERYRFHSDGALFYVTFSVVDWLPILISEAACKIVTESLNYCHHQKGLRINAYVIMPTHLHAILFHVDRARRGSPDPAGKVLEQVVTDFRKFTGRQLADFCAEHMPACFANVLAERAGGDRDRRLWQPTRHPVQIETESFWQAKIDYLHQNPVRKGLARAAEHWRFSSASSWASGGTIENDVLLSSIHW
jgi:REP element-mobilizing transposase RayT